MTALSLRSIFSARIRAAGWEYPYRPEDRPIIAKRVGWIAWARVEWPDANSYRYVSSTGVTYREAMMKLARACEDMATPGSDYTAALAEYYSGRYSEPA